jgi:AcrR family transcriptional regulator
MNTKPEKVSNATPRDSLLEAAGELFAERGFRGTTVRAICKRAGTNIATVNYYFGGKEKLYTAVLQYSVGTAIEKYPPDLGMGNKVTPQERLYAFILSLLLRLLDESRSAWHGKLMSREMAEPTSALDTLVVQVIRPLSDRLRSIVRELLGPRTSKGDIHLVASSILGQCLYYRHAHSVIRRLDPEQKYHSEDIRRLADHIMRFSLSALKEFKKMKRGRTDLFPIQENGYTHNRH